jgi:uncharacterized lipoprotein YddW (UPF0748 family)
MRRSPLLFLLLLGLVVPAAPAQEIRALWVDTFNAGMRNASEVSALVANARAGNFNAVFVEVRKRGDAYYNSAFEPKATDVSPQSYDPLADLIAKAHSGGPRIEVHAWITTYLIWNRQTIAPTQPTHPFTLHPEWLSQNDTGDTWDDANYQFDQGHPEVQKHVFNVAMDLVSNYDLDGFHFDYVRYSGNRWGYHPVAVERFKQRFNRTTTPAFNDPLWLQFRRDQVSGLVRKVYLSAIALKPQMKLSAATICFAPGITGDAQWFSSSAAYTDKLQDWRGWMQEGILDLNMPMAYFRQNDSGAGYNRATDWTNWSNFAKDHKFNRHVAMGAAVYLNSASNSIHQIRTTRVPTGSGNKAEGVSLYSYAAPGTNVTRTQFYAALTSGPNSHDANATAVFADAVAVPAMPWKTAPSSGHLKGFITASDTGLELDGVKVVLTGLQNRGQTNDATGFYGFVDLPAGGYTLTATYSNRVSRTVSVSLTNGLVTTLNLVLDPPNVSTLAGLTAHPGRTEAILTWNETTENVLRVEYGTTSLLGTTSAVDAASVQSRSVLLSGLAGDTGYFFRLVASAGTNLLTTSVGTFTTAGNLDLDNPAAAFVGSWTTGTSSTDKYLADYQFAGTSVGAETATATFKPTIATPGRYDISVWYPQGGNRSTAVPHVVVDADGSTTTAVNQTVNGGGWRLVASGKRFTKGTGGFVRVSNATPDSGKVVMADGVRFSYAADQGPVPEWWLQAYFNGPTDPALDPDQDGLTTAQEYVLGTIPTEAGSAASLRVELAATDELRLVFSPYRAGRTYRLFSSGGLESTNWNPVANAALSTFGQDTAAFSVTNLTGAQRFFRVETTLSE